MSKVKHTLETPVCVDFEELSKIVSELDSIESKAMSEFNEAHSYYCIINKEYTGIGIKYTAKCLVCGETLDITNYDNW